MEEEYEFVRMSEANFDDFARLTEDSIGVLPTRDDIRDLFDTGHWGKQFLAFLAYHRETAEVAAFYGIFPCFAEYDGKRYLAAQSGATMTHSKHRKKGLFYKTALKTFELSRAEGVNFVYGFPNQFSYRGLIKLGWSHDGDLNAYHLFVPTAPLGFLTRKAKFLGPAYRACFRSVTSRWRVKCAPFPGSSAGDDSGKIVVDEGTVKYRPETDERFMVKIGEHVAWINQQNGSLGIGDVQLTEDVAAFKKVIRTLKFIAFLSGTFHIRTYTSPGSKLDTLFQQAGYRPRPANPICHLDLGSNLPLEKFKYVYADLDTF